MLTATDSVHRQEQRWLKEGISWQQYRAVTAGFNGIPGVRLAYWDGILEIMGISKLHEWVCSMLGLLLGQYCVERQIAFFPSGAYTQTVEGRTEFQSDLSYSFEFDKDVPDLCIEVVITSGGLEKLRKYQIRGIPEVWFWQDGKVEIYYLIDESYQTQSQSQVLADLDIQLLESCVLAESPLTGLQRFRDGIRQLPT